MNSLDSVSKVDLKLWQLLLAAAKSDNKPNMTTRLSAKNSYQPKVAVVWNMRQIRTVKTRNTVNDFTTERTIQDIEGINILEKGKTVTNHYRTVRIAETVTTEETLRTVRRAMTIKIVRYNEDMEESEDILDSEASGDIEERYYSDDSDYS